MLTLTARHHSRTPTRPHATRSIAARLPMSRASIAHRGADVVVQALSDQHDRPAELLVGGVEQAHVVTFAEAAPLAFAPSVSRWRWERLCWSEVCGAGGVAGPSVDQHDANEVAPWLQGLGVTLEEGCHLAGRLRRRVREHVVHQYPVAFALNSHFRLYQAFEDTMDSGDHAFACAADQVVPGHSSAQDRLGVALSAGCQAERCLGQHDGTTPLGGVSGSVGAGTWTGKTEFFGLPVAVDAVQARNVVRSASIDERVDLLVEGCRACRRLVEGYSSCAWVGAFGLNPESYVAVLVTDPPLPVRAVLGLRVGGKALDLDLAAVLGGELEQGIVSKRRL